MKKREGVYNVIMIGAGTHLTPRRRKFSPGSTGAHANELFSE